METQKIGKRNIDSVWSETKYLASYEYKRFTTTIIIISILLCILPPLFVISFFLVIGYIIFLYTKATKTFIRHFAEINNFKYTEMAPMESVNARLFTIGTNRNITNVLTGEHLGYPLRIFNYRYTIGSGKNQQTYHFTALEIYFNNINFPHILLQSKKMWRHGYRDMFGEVKDTEIPLTNHFSDNFTLYCTEGYEIEVLEIFTPDMLEYLCQNAKNFTIEFGNNKIYIFDDKLISTKKELDTLLDVSKKILSSHGEIINRLQDDFSALHPYYTEK